MVPPGRLIALQRDPRVAYVEPNQVFKVNAQVLPTGIDRIDAERDPMAKIDGIDERVNVGIAILGSRYRTDASGSQCVSLYQLCAQRPQQQSLPG